MTLRAAVLILVILAAPADAKVSSTNDCGHEHARYEVTSAGQNAGVDIGTPMWVLRWGITKGRYAAGSMIPSGIYEMVAGPEKRALLHGPGISSMFVDYELENLASPVEWMSDNNSLPSHMRVMENDGLNMLLTIEFSRCERSPYSSK